MQNKKEEKAQDDRRKERERQEEREDRKQSVISDWGFYVDGLRPANGKKAER